MPQLDTKILRTEETTAFLQSGGVQRVYRVSFMVGDNGPFTLDFRAVDFNPQAVKDGIERVAATLRALE